MNLYGPATGPNAVRRNQWVHLAAVYDSTGGPDADPTKQLILYVNGDPYYNTESQLSSNANKPGFLTGESFMPNRI